MSQLAVDPITDPEVWDVVTFSGLAYAYCEVSGFEREYDWDEKHGKGAKGATSTFVGQTLAKGSVKFLAWEPEHFKTFAAILALLKYDPTKGSSQAIEIWHPAIAENDVNAVVAKKIGKWDHDGAGLYSRSVELLEFRPPPPTSGVATPANASTTDPSKDGTPGTQPDPAIKAAKDDFDKALADAKALGPP